MSKYGIPIIENKIPEKIKRIIKVMRPDDYEVESKRASYSIFEYYVFLKYNDDKFWTISGKDQRSAEQILGKMCEKEDAIFFVINNIKK